MAQQIVPAVAAIGDNQAATTTTTTATFMQPQQQHLTQINVTTDRGSGSKRRKPISTPVCILCSRPLLEGATYHNKTTANGQRPYKVCSVNCKLLCIHEDCAQKEVLSSGIESWQQNCVSCENAVGFWMERKALPYIPVLHWSKWDWLFRMVLLPIALGYARKFQIWLFAYILFTFGARKETVDSLWAYNYICELNDNARTVPGEIAYRYLGESYGISINGCHFLLGFQYEIVWPLWYFIVLFWKWRIAPILIPLFYRVNVRSSGSILTIR